MLPETAGQTQPIVYFTILCVVEILILVFMLAGQESDIILFNILRIFMLIMSNCLSYAAYAAYYSIFALVGALYMFDPVGLWIEGHGLDHKSQVQNAFCVIAFVLAGLAAYLGYIYKISLENDIDEAFFENAGVNRFQVSNEMRPNEQQRARDRRFEQFSGQGHALN